MRGHVTHYSTIDAIAVLVHKISYSCKRFPPVVLYSSWPLLVDGFHHRWVECIQQNDAVYFRPCRHRRHSKGRREDKHTSDNQLYYMNLYNSS